MSVKFIYSYIGFGDDRGLLLRLKDQLFAYERSKENQQKKIADMEVRLQTYVTEVKRIEELLTMRDKERSELLQQYKSLSVEIDESESYGRRMESRVRNIFPGI